LSIKENPLCWRRVLSIRGLSQEKHEPHAAPAATSKPDHQHGIPCSGSNAIDEALAQRSQQRLARRKNVEKKKMFGGVLIERKQFTHHPSTSWTASLDPFE
jgi:hypothetical protein